MPDERLRSIPFLADLDDDDLDRIGAATSERRVAAGEHLFAEGDAGEHAYVIVEGELEIHKRSGDKDVLLAVRGPGEVIGEMSLLEDAPRMAGAQARSDLLLLEVPKSVFDELLETSVAAARSLFGALLARWRETEARLRQREQLAQLGTLSAGLAHELNNPAAAARRAAAGFVDAADRVAEATAALEAAPPAPSSPELVARIAQGAEERLGSLARSDREEALVERLGGIGVSGAGRVAAALVDVEASVLDAVLDELGSLHRETASAILALAAARRTMTGLAATAVDATSRISDIVGAVKSYTFTGQAPVQEVDVTKMLDDTVTLLSHELGDIEVVREWDEVPRIEALGSELNQVWTNLIDNAIDAVQEAGRRPGRITLRARGIDDGIEVQVEDDGVGIPPEVVPRVFDSFFTTKPPGEGTGLGLDISYGIVVHHHGGDIDVDSEPGRTTITVRLPLSIDG